MDIKALLPSIESDFYSPEFMKIIEDHLTILRTAEGVQVRQLTNVQCVKYQGDLFGLFNDLRIAPKYHHAVMRVNNLFSATDYTGDVNQIVVPNLAEIDMLKNLYQTGKTN